jgi:hypothetical protein
VTGPAPHGTWTSHLPGGNGGSHQFLEPGRRYRVIKQFIDYDKVVHPAGEEWIFLGHSFLPYEDGMSFFVSLDGVQEWHIRLQWRPDEQAEILDNLASYLAEDPPATAAGQLGEYIS